MITTAGRSVPIAQTRVHTVPLVSAAVYLLFSWPASLHCGSVETMDRSTMPSSVLFFRSISHCTIRRPVRFKWQPMEWEAMSCRMDRPLISIFHRFFASVIVRMPIKEQVYQRRMFSLMSRCSRVGLIFTYLPRPGKVSMSDPRVRHPLDSWHSSTISVISPHQPLMHTSTSDFSKTDRISLNSIISRLMIKARAALWVSKVSSSAKIRFYTWLILCFSSLAFNQSASILYSYHRFNSTRPAMTLTFDTNFGNVTVTWKTQAASNDEFMFSPISPLNESIN